MALAGTLPPFPLNSSSCYGAWALLGPWMGASDMRRSAGTSWGRACSHLPRAHLACPACPHPASSSPAADAASSSGSGAAPSTPGAGGRRHARTPSSASSGGAAAAALPEDLAGAAQALSHQEAELEAQRGKAAGMQQARHAAQLQRVLAARAELERRKRLVEASLMSARNQAALLQAHERQGSGEARAWEQVNGLSTGPAAACGVCTRAPWRRRLRRAPDCRAALISHSPNPPSLPPRRRRQRWLPDWRQRGPQQKRSTLCGRRPPRRPSIESGRRASRRVVGGGAWDQAAAPAWGRGVWRVESGMGAVASRAALPSVLPLGTGSWPLTALLPPLPHTSTCPPVRWRSSWRPCGAPPRWSCSSCSRRPA